MGVGWDGRGRGDLMLDAGLLFLFTSAVYDQASAIVVGRPTLARAVSNLVSRWQCRCIIVSVRLPMLPYADYVESSLHSAVLFVRGCVTAVIP